MNFEKSPRLKDYRSQLTYPTEAFKTLTLRKFGWVRPCLPKIKSRVLVDNVHKEEKDQLI